MHEKTDRLKNVHRLMTWEVTNLKLDT